MGANVATGATMMAISARRECVDGFAPTEAATGTRASMVGREARTGVFVNVSMCPAAHRGSTAYLKKSKH